MVSNAEYEIYSMVNRCQKVNVQDCKENFPPLEVIDVEQVLADENLAEFLFEGCSKQLPEFLLWCECDCSCQQQHNDVITA